MENIISIFDFDSTLYDTPLPTNDNRELLRVFKGYDKSGWWGKSESLDLDLFDIKVIPWVKERYEYHTKENHIKVLMTGRILKLKESVLNVINQDNLNFNEYLLCDGRKTLDFKSSKIMELIEKYNPSEIYFYDDRTEHIPTFRKLGDKIEDSGIKFRLFHVIGYNGYELKYGKKLR
jgi:hypothetical protein